MKPADNDEQQARTEVRAPVDDEPGWSELMRRADAEQERAERERMRGNSHGDIQRVGFGCQFLIAFLAVMLGIVVATCLGACFYRWSGLDATLEGDAEIYASWRNDE